MGEAESYDTVLGKLTWEKHLHEKHGSKHALKRKLLINLLARNSLCHELQKPLWLLSIASLVRSTGVAVLPIINL